MDSKTLADLKAWFKQYVDGLECTNEDQKRNLSIKTAHTYRVTEEILSISQRLKLDDDASNLASAIAIFHDAGRFEQYLRYNTFSDIRSEDHAELGIRILNEHHVLDNIDAEEAGIITCAIKYHNRPSLPEDDSENCMFYSRLIRDADKLDIWKVVTDYYLGVNGGKNAALVLELPETPGISEEVYEALINRQIVDMRFVKNVNDIKLLQTGWIYDLSFGPTMETVKERQYIDKMRRTLPDTEEINDIFKEIYTTLSEKT